MGSEPPPPVPAGKEDTAVRAEPWASASGEESRTRKERSVVERDGRSRWELLMTDLRDRGQGGRTSLEGQVPSQYPIATDRSGSTPSHLPVGSGIGPGLTEGRGR